jgi:hypothetical protein
VWGANSWQSEGKAHSLEWALVILVPRIVPNGSPMISFTFTSVTPLPETLPLSVRAFRAMKDTGVKKQKD